MMKDRIMLAQMKAEMNRGVEIREEMVAKQREKQQGDGAFLVAFFLTFLIVL